MTDWGYAEATRILTERRDDLEIIGKGLLEFETLTGDEILALLKGVRPIRDDDDTKTDVGETSSVPTIGKADTGNAEPSPA